MTPEQWYKEASSMITAFSQLRTMSKRQRNEWYSLANCIREYERMKSQRATSGLMHEKDPRYEKVVTRVFEEFGTNGICIPDQPNVEIELSGYWVTAQLWVPSNEIDDLDVE